MVIQARIPSNIPANPARIPNKVGRPRAFQDEDVYEVMMTIIADVGYSGLTFALIAAQIKCTTSALIRRFGDKKSLVKGFLVWLTAAAESRFKAASYDTKSPLERIRARWLLTNMGEPAESPKRFLAFFVEVRCDPAFRPYLARLNTELEERINQDLMEAIEAGELKRTDTKVLGHLVVCAMLGSVSTWLDLQTVPIEQELNRTLDLVLAPYRA